MTNEKYLFEYQGEVLAWKIDLKSQNDPGLTFSSSPEDFIQVGLWNHPIDSILNSHIHNVHLKNTSRTSEALFVISGSIHADIYTDDCKLFESAIISAGELLVCLVGGHGYRILAENTKVLEIKNGPYFGPEIDRSPFPTQCSFCKNVQE
jgi:hypothetical protein